MVIILITCICIYCRSNNLYYGNNFNWFWEYDARFLPYGNLDGLFGGIRNRNETNFPQDWTIFYWSWWLVYAPFIGLFIARISKGRRLKEVMIGTIAYGTLGCVLFFGIFGNYAVYLQISGQFNVVDF